MRLALKHQIIMAPATVLLLMTMLLGFLQYTYWDLSVKRQEQQRLQLIFISLAEADLATQRIYVLALRLSGSVMVDISQLHQMEELYGRLSEAVSRILGMTPLADDTRSLLQQAIVDLNPGHGFDTDRFLSAVTLLRPQFSKISDQLQSRRESLRDVHNKDIDEMVAQTTFVSIVVLGTAILVGIFLSMAFARNFLSRIQALSDGAGRVARGDLTPPPPPAKIRDELDDLTVSINSMTDRLIRVVGSEKLLEGAEEERRRIAMDIHDQTLSDLSSVLRGLQDLRTAEDCSGRARALEEELQRAIANLREVMDNLHPQTLEILGFGPALQSHLESHLEKDGLPEYHLYISPKTERLPLSRTLKLALYRIAVEAIHNVIRHAGASRYEVTFDLSAEDLILSVEDNGKGFDSKLTRPAGHRGLNNIRERANAIGASAAWGTSRFSTGTRFELRLPFDLSNQNGIRS